jgi:hypothetical protein
MPVIASQPSTNRLASLANVLAFIKGGGDLASGSEGYTAIGLILDATSKAIENYCLPSPWQIVRLVLEDFVSLMAVGCIGQIVSEGHWFASGSFKSF